MSEPTKQHSGTFVICSSYPAFLAHVHLTSLAGGPSRRLPTRHACGLDGAEGLAWARRIRFRVGRVVEVCGKMQQPRALWSSAGVVDRFGTCFRLGFGRHVQLLRELPKKATRASGTHACGMTQNPVTATTVTTPLNRGIPCQQPPPPLPCEPFAKSVG